jgi:hypothetical protein
MAAASRASRQVSLVSAATAVLLLLLAYAEANMGCTHANMVSIHPHAPQPPDGPVHNL